MNNIHCPYCQSIEISIWKIKTNNKIKIYRCYSCNHFFEIRDIRDCGKQFFVYASNYSINKEILEHSKFDNMGKITQDEINDILIDLWENKNDEI